MMVALVFYCCMTNNHKLSSLKQPIYYLTVLYVSNEGRLSWILCWRPHKADIKVKWMLFGSSGDEFSSKYFQVVGRFQFFVVKGLKSLFPCFLGILLSFQNLSHSSSLGCMYLQAGNVASCPSYTESLASTSSTNQAEVSAIKGLLWLG